MEIVGEEMMESKWKNPRHNKKGTQNKLYSKWKQMKMDVNNTFRCDEWDDYDKFCDWSYDNGFYIQPDNTPRKYLLSLDRIDNLDREYKPSNCIWVSVSENAGKDRKGKNHPMFGKPNTGAGKPPKRIRIWNDDGFDKVYVSAHEAGRQLKLDSSNLAKAARGKAKTTGGYCAEYL